jgi:N6-adenosine-specific RNA methylase IME4
MSFKAAMMRREKAGLPDILRDKIEYVKIGRDQLVAFRAMASAAMKKGDMEARRQVMDAAQTLAEDLVDTEASIGETIKNIPNKKASSGASTRSLPDGINKFQSSAFQTLAANKDLIEKATAEARENDDLVTRSEVIRLAKVRETEKRNKNMKHPKMPDGVFDVILADPPWQYDNTGFEMSAEKQYPTMATDDIIKNIVFTSHSDSVLFLWVTNPLLIDGLRVMREWGFDYKTNFVWTKEKHTAGFYVFGQHELLMIGVKGSKLPAEKNKSIITGKNDVHSKKPDCVYDIIESMYPKCEYLELFARRKRDGWESYGNEL